MKVRVVIMILLISISLFSVASYSQTGEKVDMYAKVTKVVFDKQGKIKKIMVENINKDKGLYDKAVAIVTEDTRVIKDNMETSQLEVGEIVGIIFKEGPITRIYPAQIKAEVVKVIDNHQGISQSIMAEFNILIKQDTTTSKILQFIDNNISLLSTEDASLMINQFELIQKRNLATIAERFYDNDMQSKMNGMYGLESDLSKVNDRSQINKINDHNLRKIIQETIDSGYKIEIAEGMYFPIINYGLYQEYKPYVSTDIKDYIDIMAMESNEVPAKDAALVISWEEVLKRALRQEEFINTSADSVKIEEIKKLYKKYLNFTFFGLNNTPLFNYQSKVLVDNAKNTYMKAVRGKQESKLIETLKEFIIILEENKFRLTDEVDNYRKNVLRNILATYDVNQSNCKDVIAAMQQDIDMLKKESSVQQIHQSNYGDMAQMTKALRVTDSQLQFDAVSVVFSANYQGYFTPGKSYPYYIDAAAGGQRGINVKDDFGVWHSFGYRVPMFQ